MWDLTVGTERNIENNWEREHEYIEKRLDKVDEQNSRASELNGNFILLRSHSAKKEKKATPKPIMTDWYLIIYHQF